MATAAEWLVDQTDANLARRRQETIDLRFLLESSSGSRQALLARASQAISYAHWEGFVKFACRSYVEHLIKVNRPISALRWELQALFFKQQVTDRGKSDDTLAAVNTLLRGIENRTATVFSIDPDLAIRSGNMNSDALKSMLVQLGLDYGEQFAVRQNYIDSTICGPRHRIAHGELEPIDSDEARSRIVEVMRLCDAVNDGVQTAAVYELYLAA